MSSMPRPDPARRGMALSVGRQFGSEERVGRAPPDRVFNRRAELPAPLPLTSLRDVKGRRSRFGFAPAYVTAANHPADSSRLKADSFYAPILAPGVSFHP